MRVRLCACWRTCCEQNLRVAPCQRSANVLFHPQQWPQAKHQSCSQQPVRLRRLLSFPVVLDLEPTASVSPLGPSMRRLSQELAENERGCDTFNSQVRYALQTQSIWPIQSSLVPANAQFPTRAKLCHSLHTDFRHPQHPIQTIASHKSSPNFVMGTCMSQRLG